MKISVRPTKGNVLIEPVDDVPETFLHLPDKVKNHEMPRQGRVFAIGCSRMTKKGAVIPTEFKICDIVYFRKFSGLWIEIRGKKFIQIKIEDVEAIIE